MQRVPICVTEHIFALYELPGLDSNQQPSG